MILYQFCIRFFRSGRRERLITSRFASSVDNPPVSTYTCPGLLPAEKEILKSVTADGILVQAQDNAESYMMRLLRGLGYPDVVFVDAPPEPTAEP